MIDCGDARYLSGEPLVEMLSLSEPNGVVSFQQLTSEPECNHPFAKPLSNRSPIWTKNAAVVETKLYSLVGRSFGHLEFVSSVGSYPRFGHGRVRSARGPELTTILDNHFQSSTLATWTVLDGGQIYRLQFQQHRANRNWVRFPSPAPETLMTQLTLHG